MTPIVQGSFTIDPAGSTVTMGDGQSSTNIIAIAVKNNGADANVRVTLNVECGNSSNALLAATTAHIDASCTTNGKKVTVNKTPTDQCLQWQTDSFGTTLSSQSQLLISLTNFESNTPPGDASVKVIVEVSNKDNNFEGLGGDKSLKIAKNAPKTDHAKIHYFLVNPDYVLHAGQTDVWIDFFATDFTSVVLYRNNQEVQVWTMDKDGEQFGNKDNPINGILGEFPRGTFLFSGPDSWKDPFDPLTAVARDEFEKQNCVLSERAEKRSGRDWVVDDGATRYRIRKERGKLNVYGGFSIFERPSITMVYRLVGKVGDSVKETLYRTVQLISPGWNQIALPQGYPTRLFVNQDFSGSGVERLYGIFIDGNGKASLYSSATGVDDWRPEAHGEVPQHMATSPGVAYDNKLWLIGGSCVDANNPGSEVWCYEEDPNTKVRRWNKKSDFPRDMTARMGHACVVFRQEIWVLGGYNQQNASSYQDVWCLEKVSVSPEKYNWELVSQKCAWSPRLNPAVVTFQKTQTDSELWIYGGSAKPQSGGLYDLWSTTDGTTWKQKSDTISPDPGTPLGATLVTYSLPDSPGSRISDRLLLIGSFLEWAPGRQPQDGQQGKSGNRVSSFLFEWQSLKLLWEANPAFKGWQQFRGDNFYMQAVAFNGFLFVWSLQPKIESTLKLNILVP